MCRTGPDGVREVTHSCRPTRRSPVGVRGGSADQARPVGRRRRSPAALVGRPPSRRLSAARDGLDGIRESRQLGLGYAAASRLRAGCVEVHLDQAGDDPAARLGPDPEASGGTQASRPSGRRRRTTRSGQPCWTAPARRSARPGPGPPAPRPCRRPPDDGSPRRARTPSSCNNRMSLAGNVLVTTTRVTSPRVAAGTAGRRTPICVLNLVQACLDHLVDGAVRRSSSRPSVRWVRPQYDEPPQPPGRGPWRR